MNQCGSGLRKRLSPFVKALRWFFGVARSYAEVRLSPDEAWSGADSGNARSRSDLARDASNSQPRAQRARYCVGDSMAERGTSGDRNGDGALESLSKAIPTCGLHGAERFSTAAKPEIAFRRIAPLPDGVPLPGGLYEWFDSDWKDVFVACPLNWASEHRPLAIVDVAAKRVLWQVWEPYFSPELARQAANMAVELVELGRKDATNGCRPYQRL
jgi:hypothetical protein